MIPDLRQPFIVFLPFLAAAMALLIGRWTGRRTGWLMILAAATSFVLTVSLMVAPAQAMFSYDYNWIESLTIRLSFLGDPFGLFFAALVSGIGTMVGIYSLHYIPELPNARVGRYYAALIAFMGAMLGVSLSDDMMLLFVFWEITSITSFMLIGFWYEKDEAKKGALTALQVTAMGGLAMMAGFIMVGNVTGTFSLHELRNSPDLIAKLEASSIFVPALLLVLLGAFTKSAQWPFHFWLPNAMVAPTPVSCYLHSATMVKAGVFLVGRMLPLFGNAECWSPILISVGLFTFVYTAYQAFQETDLKAILARTTLSTLGLVMFVYGLKASPQDALQILNHAAYKGTLFLIVGIVEHATHTRDIRLLGGLRKHMPITFGIALLAALSMSGLPPFLGFMAKEALYAEVLHSPVLAGRADLHWLIIGACVVANAFTFAVACKLIFGVFLGKETEAAHHAHEAERGLWMPAAGLVSVAVILGVLGVSPLTQNLVASLSSYQPAAHGAAAGAEPAHLHVSLIPHEVGPVVLTIFTIAIGLLLYQNRAVVEAAQRRIAGALPAMQRIWDEMLHSVSAFATAYSDYWQRGSLRWYLGAILAFSTALMLYMLDWTGIPLEAVKINTSEVPWYALSLMVLLCVAGVTLALSRSRLQAAVASTATGFLTSLMFVVYRSPDILLTQILIETVATIFLLLILYFMPPFPKREPLSHIGRFTNLAIAVAVGFAAFLYVLYTTSETFRTKDNLAIPFLEASKPIGGGDNAVNVVIVDFRAGDTMGEITVLFLVSVLVYGLIRSRRKPALAPVKYVEQTPET